MIQIGLIKNEKEMTKKNDLDQSHYLMLWYHDTIWSSQNQRERKTWRKLLDIFYL